MSKKYLNLIGEIKNNNRFVKKEFLTLIDDLEAFKVFVKSQNYKKFQILAIFINKNFEKEFFQEFSFAESDLYSFNLYPIEREILSRYLDIENAKICALIKIPKEIEILTKNFVEAISKNEISIILDSVENPWNLGGIFRNNCAFGIFNSVLTTHSVFPYNPRVIRSSKGFIFQQNIKILNNQQLRELVNTLKEFKTYFLENRENSKDILKCLNFFSNSKIFFVFGNEEKGITEETRKIFKNYESLKINIRIESLNLFSAHSITAFLWYISKFSKILT